LTACFILNRVPHKKLDLTPYELWKGYAPNLKYLKVWGCFAKVALPSHKCSNIDPKMFDVVFIGYAQNSVAYRFMSLFDFFLFLNIKMLNFLKMDVPHVVSNAVSQSMNMPASNSNIRELVVEPKRSKRQRTETSFGPNFITSFLVKVL